MTNSLTRQVRGFVTDPAVAGFVAESELEPLAGPTATIAPATYAHPAGITDRNPKFAWTERAPIPALNAAGWRRDTQRGLDGVARLAGRVVVDSVGSQSGRAETALWKQQERLGVVLPGIVVTGSDVDTPGSTFFDRQVADALDISVSSWELAHRHADGWIRYARTDDGRQVWSGGVNADGVVPKDVITSACENRTDLLFGTLPNAAVYGFWLASGVSSRHRLPRAYSSEIVGYGAMPVQVGMTKLDPAGGLSGTSQVKVVKDELVTTAGKKGGDAKAPSAFGFGQVPATPATRSFVCELILQQSSLSMSILRRLRFDIPEQRDAALTVLSLLALTGRALSNEDGFLRSGCSLVTVDERWGWRRAGAATPISPVEVSGVTDLAEALVEAVDDAAHVGVAFAPRIALAFSDAQRDLIRERVTTEMAKLGGAE